MHIRLTPHIDAGGHRIYFAEGDWNVFGGNFGMVAGAAMHQTRSSFHSELSFDGWLENKDFSSKSRPFRML
jgi:hypothetical protein